MCMQRFCSSALSGNPQSIDDDGCLPDSTLLPYLLAALFSVHSLIAGFALGVNHSLNRTAIATAVAIFSHKVSAHLALLRLQLSAADTLALLCP